MLAEVIYLTALSMNFEWLLTILFTIITGISTVTCYASSKILGGMFTNFKKFVFKIAIFFLPHSYKILKPFTSWNEISKPWSHSYLSAYFNNASNFWSTAFIVSTHFFFQLCDKGTSTRLRPGWHKENVTPAAEWVMSGTCSNFKR